MSAAGVGSRSDRKQKLTARPRPGRARGASSLEVGDDGQLLGKLHKSRQDAPVRILTEYPRNMTRVCQEIITYER